MAIWLDIGKNLEELLRRCCENHPLSCLAEGEPPSVSAQALIPEAEAPVAVPVRPEGVLGETADRDLARQVGLLDERIAEVRALAQVAARRSKASEQLRQLIDETTKRLDVLDQFTRANFLSQGKFVSDHEGKLGVLDQSVTALRQLQQTTEGRLASHDALADGLNAKIDRLEMELCRRYDPWVEKLLALEQVFKASNLDRALRDLQQGNRILTARVEQIEERDLPQQHYNRIYDRATANDPPAHLREGSFVWALLQLRKGVAVRRASWPDTTSHVEHLRDLIRELDIAPEADLVALDWLVYAS